MPAGPSHDPRGNPCGTRNAAALAAAETALWRMMSFYDVPTADLDAATAHDPGWALPHLMRAGFVLSLTEPALLNEAASHLQRARALADGAPARERAHLDAVTVRSCGCVRRGRCPSGTSPIRCTPMC